MAPVTGAWRRSNVSTIPYAGAAVWGTGINPVHSVYGSPALRLSDYPVRETERVTPFQAVPEQLIAKDLWGYTTEDGLYTGLTYDDRPAWNEQPDMFRGNTGDQPPMNATGMSKSVFRGMKDGAHRFGQKLADALPTETVSEGWLNKPKGDAADAKPSDPSQYERQTSMQQRYATRTNEASVNRATDEPREVIASRVIGQRLKVYSGGERHYDMLPKQQDTIPRPFWYRTAGTGKPYDMRPNSQIDLVPLQRIPPGDPAIGVPETQLSSEYGYTEEDYSYA